MREDASSGWGWFVALGVGLIALGMLAFSNLAAATTVSVYMVGVAMLIGALVQIVAIFFVRDWPGFTLALVGALLYGAAGVFTIMDPTLAGKALTLWLAVSLIFSGGMRIWWSTRLQPLPGWAWVTLSGIVSIIAGVVFMAGWPADTVYLLGIVLAVDLTFQGASAIGFGIAVKQANR
ncbi:MAG TPA: HdeD family acid-resistance protein [Casimicrobiaceae bacterium]|nr:HdeD family acid-resistance protein [Casimicrobiaceae bacterium]